MANGHLGLVWRLMRERAFDKESSVIYILKINLFCDTGDALPNQYLKIY